MTRHDVQTSRLPLAIAFAAALGVGAMADVPVEGQLDHGAAQPPKFEDWDKNKDGYVAKDEVPAAEELVAKFALFDTDSDGKLSRDEFAKFLAARGAPAHDKNRT
jgi:hypothetical protein